MNKSRYARMSELQNLQKDAKMLFCQRVLQIYTAIWDTTEGDGNGTILGIPLGILKKKHHEKRSWEIKHPDHKVHDSLFTNTPQQVYEAIPGLKELTDKFLQESDELIRQGVETFQKEFDELDKMN